MFDTIGGWHWLVLSLLLWGIGWLRLGGRWAFGLQCLAWGLAAAAAGTALVLAIVWLPMTWQLTLSAVLSVLGIAASWVLLRVRWAKNATAAMCFQAPELVGIQASLATATHQGQAKAQIRDAIWTVSCDQNLPRGTLVEVIGYDGAVLHVKKC